MDKYWFWFLLIFICLMSCDKNRVFDEYKSLPNEWNKDSIISFEVKEMDTIQKYDLFINIRNTNDFEYNNLFLITHINFPHGKVVQDTLEYQMSYPDGEWMGVGAGENKASKLWYKKGVRFEEEGTYTFKIRHAMRKNGERESIENLKGITEVGLRVEKPE